MWVARVLQVISLLLAVASVFAVTYVSINFPLHEAHSPANNVTGIAYLVLVAPIALLYLIIGLPSTLFLLSKKRRAAYGFTVTPWSAIFWTNVCVLVALAGSQIAASLVIVFFALTA